MSEMTSNRRTVRSMLTCLRMTVAAIIVLLSGLPATAQDTVKLDLWLAPFGTVFDRECQNLLKTQFESQWVQEAVQRAGEFQAAWDSQGVRFLQAATTEIGAPFPYREMQAALILCPISSTSTPLLLQIRPFLASTPGPKQPLWMFALNAFHELMHHYVGSIPGESRLRQKYAGEALVTLNHLPVLALERLALSRLKMTTELQLLDSHYRTSAPPVYKRAWEIVTDSEGPDAFIAELKQFATQKR